MSSNSVPPQGRSGQQQALAPHHDLKVWPQHFAGLWDRSKHHEVRRDDRKPSFHQGDTVILREYLPGQKVYTGRHVRGVIGNVTAAGFIGTNVNLPAPLVVFTFLEHSRGGGGDDVATETPIAGGNA